MLQIITTDAYLLSTFLVEFDKFSKNFVPVKPCIVRPANRDWACQTERCHTLSNKTSLQ